MIRYRLPPHTHKKKISSSNNLIQQCPDEDGTQASGGASMSPLRSSLAAEKKHYFQATVKQGTLTEHQTNQSNRSSESKRKERTRTRRLSFNWQFSKAWSHAAGKPLSDHLVGMFAGGYWLMIDVGHLRPLCTAPFLSRLSRTIYKASWTSAETKATTGLLLSSASSSCLSPFSDFLGDGLRPGS